MDEALTAIFTFLAITANTLKDILYNYLSLFLERWFVAAVLMAFLFGQAMHAYLRGYHPKMRDLAKAFLIWGTQLGVGFGAAILLMDKPDEMRYALIAGGNSIAIYYLLLWLATKWFKWPKVAKFLTLKNVSINRKGEIDFGETIQFLQPKRGRKRKVF